MNNNDKIRDKQESSVISGFAWKLAERFLAQIITFLVSIILARLLAPDDYGVISIVLIFITFSDVLVSNGFGTALIQKKDANEVDFSTLFYCSFFVSIIIYILIYISAPLIADFYDNSILTPVIRIFCIRIPISSYNSIQHAYVSRHMMFKKFFYSTLGGTLVSAIVGIYLAYNGFGVWAIVGQYLTNTIIDSIVLSFTVPWRPKKAFSWSSAKNLMKYGWKVAGASFSGTFFTQLRSLIIGKFFTPADLVFLLPRNDRKLLYLTVTKLLVIMTKTNEKEKEIITAQSFDEHKLVITSFVAKSHGYYNKLRAVCQSQRKNYLSES